MLPKTGKKLHRSRRGHIIQPELAHSLALALRSELGMTHQAIKTVMRWTGASERTVKHWFAGTHNPSSAHLISLTARSDRAFEVFLTLSDRQTVIASSAIVSLRSRLVEIVDQIDRHI